MPAARDPCSERQSICDVLAKDKIARNVTRRNCIYICKLSRYPSSNTGKLPITTHNFRAGEGKPGMQFVEVDLNLFAHPYGP
jgi:hypothetical protein